MDEPWKTPPPVPAQPEDHRRYQRSLRLTQFQRDIDRWRRAGLMEHPRYVERVAYRQHCLTHWREYLDGEIAPPEGRKPTRGEKQ
jgi:hypothetical protein